MGRGLFIAVPLPSLEAVKAASNVVTVRPSCPLSQ